MGTVDTTALRALLARVEGAASEDEVAEGAPYTDPITLEIDIWRAVWRYTDMPWERKHAVGWFCRRVDDALRFAERVLPIHGLSVGYGTEGRKHCHIKPHPGVAVQATAATPALAIVAAVLRALCAREGERGDG